MVYRLDPRYPLVWRSPSSMQIGVDPPRVVLDEVDDGAERMLAALVTGATRDGLAVLGGGGDPDALLSSLGPALEDPPPAAGRGIAVFGQGSTAVRISRILDEHGRWCAEVGDAPPYPEAVVIVSQFVTPPAIRSVWLRRDVPHLPVVFSDTGVLIGPLVQPGAGPCLTCIELHHRDRDPAWPALAAQLYDRTSQTDYGTLSAEAAATAVRMLASLAIGSGAAVRLDAESGERTESVVTQHPQCSCNGGGPLVDGPLAAADTAGASAQLGQEAAR